MKPPAPQRFLNLSPLCAGRGRSRSVAQASGEGPGTALPQTSVSGSPAILTNHFQSACLAANTTTGKTPPCPTSSPSIRAPPPRARSCSGRTSPSPLSAAGIPAAFSGIRLGRARAGGHLDLDHRHLPRGAEESRPHRKGHRGHRHHQPARDHGGVGSRHRAGDPPRHRLAGPPHRRHLRETEGRRPRAGNLGENRADHRSVFFRHQSCLDPRPRPRRARSARSAAN